VVIDVFNYPQIVDQKTREAVRCVLEYVAKNGFQRDHHFYITFMPTYPGVEMPSFLLEKASNDITIVLQNQFSQLVVKDYFFSVLLIFKQIPHKLVIPFASLVKVYDPSVNFKFDFLRPNPASINNVDKSDQLRHAYIHNFSKIEEHSADINGDHAEKNRLGGTSRDNIIDIKQFRKKD